MGWAGPAQPTGLDSAQKCWADFGPKWIGPISAQKTSIPLLGQARPRRRGWARIRLAQQPKRAGGIISPPPLHVERYSFCMQKRKQKTRVRVEKSYLAQRRCLAASLAVLWRRPVAVSWLMDGGSKQRRYPFERRCYVFSKFFYPFAAFPSYISVPLPFGSFSPLFGSLCFLSFFLPFVFLSFVFLSSVFSFLPLSSLLSFFFSPSVLFSPPHCCCVGCYL